MFKSLKKPLIVSILLVAVYFIYEQQSEKVPPHIPQENLPFKPLTAKAEVKTIVGSENKPEVDAADIAPNDSDNHELYATLDYFEKDLLAKLRANQLPSPCKTICVESHFDRSRNESEGNLYLQQYYSQDPELAVKDPEFRHRLAVLNLVSLQSPESYRKMSAYVLKNSEGLSEEEAQKKFAQYLPQMRENFKRMKEMKPFRKNLLARLKAFSELREKCSIDRDSIEKECFDLLGPTQQF